MIETGEIAQYEIIVNICHRPDEQHPYPFIVEQIRIEVIDKLLDDLSRIERRRIGRCVGTHPERIGPAGLRVGPHQLAQYLAQRTLARELDDYASLVIEEEVPAFVHEGAQVEALVPQRFDQGSSPARGTANRRVRNI